MAQTLTAFERVFIDRQSLGSAVVERLRMKLPNQSFEIVDGPPLGDRSAMTAQEFDRSKRLLYVRPFPGQFFKRCPGATQKKSLACCNYHVLNLGQQCNFNCSYCYLQDYLNTPTLQIYSNIDKALAELKVMADSHGELPYRVGTGEIIDSLSLDPFTLYSRDLIDFFRSYPKWTLEFKTKSDCVDQFLDCNHAGNVVASWSINPAKVIEHEEHGTASLQQRLQAAQKCRARGFQIAFHIDPMIYFEGWQEHYLELVQKITTTFLPEEINVISLGALRFQPRQRHLMRERFGMESWVAGAEVFPSDGGKMRYDFHLRQEMYQFVLQAFRDIDSRYKIFLCMEAPETWIANYDKTPMNVPELHSLFRPLPRVPDQPTLS